MKIKLSIFFGALSLLGSALGADWPSFGGLNRDFISSEQDLILKWGDREPDKLWQAKIGAGYSSIVVGGGLAYAVGNENEKNVVQCLNALKGSLVWKYEYSCGKGAKYFDGGSRGTPTLDDGALYSLSHEGALFAFDAKTGRVKWARHLLKDFAGRRPTWGFSGCPLVAGNLLIVETGSTKGSLVALDKKTGKLTWRSGESEAGYASPMLRSGKSSQGLSFDRAGLSVFNVSDGERIARFSHKTRYGINAAQPVDMGDYVLISSGYGKGAALVDLTGASPRSKWESEEIACQMSGGVRKGDFYFGVHGQTGGRARHSTLRCVEIMTGKIRWEKEGFGVGTVIRVGETLVILSDRGEIALVAADPSAFKELSRFPVLRGTEIWTPPTYANGLLYCRNKEGDLICLRMGSD
jgi:outer membrane protein assembly factor BamB